MAGMVDSMLDQLTKSGMLEMIAGQVGIDPKQATSLASGALPAIMAGLAKNAQKPEGAASLSKALDDHAADFDDPNYADNVQNMGGDKILGHVFGDKTPAVEAQVAKSSGVSAEQGAGAMNMLAPMVMGFLGKEKAGGNFDMNSLTGLLGGKDGLQLPGGLDKTLGLSGGGQKGGLSGMLSKLFGRN